MHLLDSTLRPYAWGSRHAIADLLGREPSGEPEAELWIGAHPDSPSRIADRHGDGPGLDEIIGEDPKGLLGEATAERFGDRLPFLLKVLAADSALSLQVHPSAEQAAAGFDAEESDGVPRSAAHRTYRDRNPKPEMLYPLSDFEALCGFRPLSDAVATFAFLATAVEPGSPAHDLLDSVAARLVAGGEEALRAVFTQLLHAAPGIVKEVADAVGQIDRREESAGAAAPGPVSAAVPRRTDDAVVLDLATVRELSAQYPEDPGVLVALLLNRVSLRPGEAIYLPAGNVHAYLSGLGIEVMASSDNVLRGGLTSKHVAPDELLETVVFEATAPPTLLPEYTLFDQELYRPPFDEFQLQRIVLADSTAGPGHARPGGSGAGRAGGVTPPAGTTHADAAPAHVPVVQNGPVVVLAVSGPILLDTPRSTLSVPRGASAFVGAAEAPLIVRPAADEHGATAGPVLAFAVTVGTAGPSDAGVGARDVDGDESR
ncbi:mannose-6-phosphate isomerase, class I [Arthrobacter echini]|uniref:mannose-6-phosphate isomerase n=1 Tax=Arthrobacter echini TaxID=1529066 RepID=A0A4S5E8G9_9MICC|nr:mannose-6-phosphate isomerase, class I [Arthrobacter echini]THJ67884.1 mannose-6-phosphate isomerase, class I [Arthrobacter echini]